MSTVSLRRPFSSQTTKSIFLLLLFFNLYPLLLLFFPMRLTSSRFSSRFHRINSKRSIAIFLLHFFLFSLLELNNIINHTKKHKLHIQSTKSGYLEVFHPVFLRKLFNLLLHFLILYSKLSEGY